MDQVIVRGASYGGHVQESIALSMNMTQQQAGQPASLGMHQLLISTGAAKKNGGTNKQQRGNLDKTRPRTGRSSCEPKLNRTRDMVVP
jgi:hypothetical protein